MREQGEEGGDWLQETRETSGRPWERFYLVTAGVTRLGTFVKTHQIVHLTLVSCAVHKLHTSRAEPPKRPESMTKNKSSTAVTTVGKWDFSFILPEEPSKLR